MTLVSSAERPLGISLEEAGCSPHNLRRKHYWFFFFFRRALVRGDGFSFLCILNFGILTHWNLNLCLQHLERCGWQLCVKAFIASWKIFPLLLSDLSGTCFLSLVRARLTLVAWFLTGCGYNRADWYCYVFFFSQLRKIGPAAAQTCSLSKRGLGWAAASRRCGLTGRTGRTVHCSGGLGVFPVMSSLKWHSSYFPWLFWNLFMYWNTLSMKQDDQQRLQQVLL